MWIFGACSPGRGMPLNSPTTALGSSVALDFAVFLDQRRDPPLAVAGEVELGRVDDAGGVGVFGGRLGAERRLGREAFRSRPGRGRRRAVPAPALRPSRPAPCCPTSTSRPGSASAPWRSRGRLRRRTPGCGRVRRRRTGSGSRPCRRPCAAGETTSSDGPSAAFSSFGAGSCLRRLGKVALRRRRAAFGLAAASRRSSRSSRSRRRSRRAARRRRAGRRRRRARRGRHASAPCYSDRARPVRRDASRYGR